MAPGSAVAWQGGGSIRATGNSFATPHVSGICARILGAHPALTPFQVKSLLYLTAANVRAAIEYCLRHPRWRLSVQTHKAVGIR